MTTEPSPTELRELAADAAALAARTRAMAARLDDSDDTVKRVAWALTQAADEALQDYQEEIGKAADSLARARVARDPGLCGIPWGVCPEHGNTLRGTAGRTWCTAARCGKTWDYDRQATPCPEPTVAAATGADGTEFNVCAGHAIDVEKTLVGSTVLYWSGRIGHGPQTL